MDQNGPVVQEMKFKVTRQQLTKTIAKKKTAMTDTFLNGTRELNKKISRHNIMKQFKLYCHLHKNLKPVQKYIV